MKRLALGFIVVAALMAAAFFGAENLKSEDSALRTFRHPEWAEFAEFMFLHQRYYSNELELMQRFGIFRANKAKIDAHNALKLNWTQGLNKFGDLTQVEFKQRYLCSMEPISQRRYGEQRAYDSGDEVDWTSKGIVTDVKDQGQCGSCWAFSTTGSLEAAYAQSSGTLVSLSEQQLVDCSRDFKNMGCGGGLMDWAFQYLQNHTLESEGDYPYTAKDGTCVAVESKGVTGVKSYNDVNPNENALAAALAERVVSVGVCAEYWQFYDSGIVAKDGCGCTQLDHGVTLVGMGVSDEYFYWRIKNSWGTSWGEKGFIRLQRTKSDTSTGTCGLASTASYPLL